MSSNIMLNKSNIVNRSNSKLVYNFPSTVELKEDNKIALTHLNIYYSWFNITSKNNNNKFSYMWWDEYGALTKNITVTIPDGFYSVGDLNEYLQMTFAKNGHYLATVDGKSFMYMIEIRANPVTYSIEIVLNPISQTYNADDGNGRQNYEIIFQIPELWLPPVNYECSQVIIQNTNKFGLLLGFNPKVIIAELTDIADGVPTSYNVSSDFTPNMEPSSSFFVTCNLVQNDLSIPNDLLTSFTVPSGASFGDTINPITDIVYSKVKPASYRSVTVQIYDQDFNELEIKDPNMLLILSII